MFFYFDYTWLILVPAIIISIWAQARVRSTYSRYSKVPTKSGIKGARFAQQMLQKNNVSNIRIQGVQGQMTDHFDPRARTVNLSEGVYDSSSVAAVAIAAHECGHVLQQETRYAPMKIRHALVPVVNICSNISLPLILIGFIFAEFDILVNIGAWLYFAMVVFQLVTLPVEFNASKRALANINSMGVLTASEQDEAKKVLSAAALTYVAAMLSALLSFLRLLLIANSRSRRH